MLRAMRRNTKIIMLVVALAFVGLMVFEWGMDASGRSSPTNVGEVGRVNGTAISYQVWTTNYRSLTDQARQQKGSALNDQELDFIEDQTWNQLVNQILIEGELQRRGIAVTDEEIKLAFQTLPPPWLQNNELFQTGGQFDYEKYRAFFSGPAVDPQLLLQIEQYYRSILPRARLLEQISSGIYVPDSELWNLYRDREERLRVRYVVIDPDSRVQDTEVALSEEELRRFYNENREDFKQPATADVLSLNFTRVPDPADSAAALATAQSIRAEILAGADFTEQAETHSADFASAARGGELGWFERGGGMVPAFEQAAFALKPGEISEPALTQFGYHVIKLEEKEADRARAAHILIPINLGGQSEDELLGTVDRTERIALRHGLQEAADSIGQVVRRVSISKDSEFVPGLGLFAPVSKWAFHDSTSTGDLSPVYETEDGYHFFELAERSPEGYLPFAEAEPAIRRRVTLQKKLEVARRLASGLSSEIQAGKTLSQIAAENGLTTAESPLFTRLEFVPGIGQANAVVGTAFGLSTNRIAGPIESDDQLFFVEVLERKEADGEAFAQIKETLRAQLSNQRRQIALDEWLADLREKADIRDFRRDFFVPRS